jgi:predicted transcriptional regulator
MTDSTITAEDASLPDAPSESTVKGFLSVSAVIRKPRLAQLYTAVLRNEPITGSELGEMVGIPSSTLYTDLNQLVEMGAVEISDDTRPKEYTADTIRLTVQHDGDTFHVTPTVVAAIGATETNDELEAFYERHGLATFAAALGKTRDYLAGRVTRRMIASDLDVTAAEGIAATIELEELIHDMVPYDPYIEIPAFDPPFDTGDNGE